MRSALSIATVALLAALFVLGLAFGYVWMGIGTVEGALAGGGTGSDAAASLRGLRVDVALLAAGSGAVLLLIGIHAYGLGTDSLREIARKCRAIRAGSLGERVPEWGPREVARVAGEVNAMASALAQREATLRRERDFSRALIDTANAMVVALDAEGRVTTLNRTAEETLGHRLEDLKGRDFFAAVCPEGQAAWQPGQGIPRAFECAVLTRGGQVRIVSWHNGELRDGDRFAGTIAFGLDVTERRHAEEARGRLAALVEASVDGVLGKTPEGVITSWTPGCERIYGYAASEAVGRNVTFLVPPEGEAQEASILARLRRGEAVRDLDVERVRKDGGRLRISLTAYPVRDADGNVVGVASIHRDVTGQRATEDALRESEARMRDIVEHSTNLFYVHGVDQVLTYLSPRTREFFDCEPAEALQRWTEFLVETPSNAAGLLATERALATGVRQAPYELELMGVRGRRIWVEVSEAPILREGKVVGMVGALTDVTERKRAREELRLKEQRLVEAQAIARLGSWEWDVLADRITWSDELYRLYGLAPQSIEVDYASFLERIHPHDRDLVRGAVEEALRSGASFEFDHRIVLPGGEERHLHGQGAVMLGPDGRPVRMAGTSQDVTEQRRAEESRRLAHERLFEIERLKEMDRFKTNLLNTVSHELNTPLTPLKLQLDLLKRAHPGAWSEPQLRAIAIIDRNVNRFATLVADFLDVARHQSGQLRLKRRTTDVGEVAREAVEAFVEQARRGDVALEVTAPPGISTDADPQRLSQVLYNLVSNALKFTPAGGRVTVRLAREGDRAVVRVEDTGDGLTEEQSARLFQPFAQVHDHVRSPRGGTGLGLYICRGIVEQHGGRIWCASDGPGKGTTFAFELPLLPEAQTSPS